VGLDPSPTKLVCHDVVEMDDRVYERVMNECRTFDRYGNSMTKAKD
jgi:hypothetical protein